MGSEVNSDKFRNSTRPFDTKQLNGKTDPCQLFNFSRQTANMSQIIKFWTGNGWAKGKKQKKYELGHFLRLLCFVVVVFFNKSISELKLNYKKLGQR